MGGAASPKISTMLPNVSLFDCEAHDLLYEGLQGHEKRVCFLKKESNFGRTLLRIPRTNSSISETNECS